MAFVTAFLSSNAAALTGLHGTSFTVAFWLNPFAADTEYSLILDRAWNVILNADGTLVFSILNSPLDIETSVITTEEVVADDWNHVAVVYNKEALTLSIYLNGVVATVSYTDEADDSVSVYSEVFQLGEVENVS